ncbi:unnamed protein product [Aphanomyces euteiches]
MREPLLIAYTTATSEAALPKVFEALDAFGVSKHITAFVVPFGYSFNLVGSTLYLTLASMFCAQAAGAAAALLRGVSWILSEAKRHANLDGSVGDSACISIVIAVDVADGKAICRDERTKSSNPDMLETHVDIFLIKYTSNYSGVIFKVCLAFQHAVAVDWHMQPLCIHKGTISLV